MERAKSIRFDRFEIDLERRRLLSDGEQVALTSKAFDLLVVLATHCGELITKERLLDLVWEGQYVEENNLTVHVAALRKALGEQKGENKFIATVPGRGYQFVASVTKPARNDEVIVERTSYQRVVIEEEIIDNGDAKSERPMLPPVQGRVRPPFALAAAMLVGVIATAAWFYISKASDSEPAALLKTETFTTPGGIPERVAISPDGRSIAYTVRRNSVDSLWLGDPESGNSVQLIEPLNRIHQYLALDPEGKNVYFTVRDNSHRVWTLMRISIFGGAVKELTTGVNSSISFSPDGKRIAFVRRGKGPDGQSLMTVDSETGKNESVLLRPDPPQRFVGNGVSWSPDGTRIAIGISDKDGMGCRINTVSLEDASIATISDVPCASGSNLVWRPDGKALLLLTTGRKNEKRNLVEISYPEGSARELLDSTLSFSMYCLSAATGQRIALLTQRTDTEIRVAESIDVKASELGVRGSSISSEGNQGVAIAPDGKLIFAATRGTSRVIMESDTGGTPRQLTPSQGGEEDGQVSVTADNRYIVFESSRSGNPEIWRANRDGGSLLQLTAEGNSSEPAISPDGRYIFYTHRKNGAATVRRISIEGGSSEKIVDNATWPAVSPDGKSIAYSVSPPGSADDTAIAIVPVSGGAPAKTFPLVTTGILYNRLRWSPDGRSVIYKDMVDGLWRQPVNSGGPERIAGFEDFRVYHFAFTPEGKVIYSGGKPVREITIASPRN